MSTRRKRVSDAQAQFLGLATPEAAAWAVADFDNPEPHWWEWAAIIGGTAVLDAFSFARGCWRPIRQ